MSEYAFIGINEFVKKNPDNLERQKFDVLLNVWRTFFEKPQRF
jgi:hypothetical protein